MTSLLRLSKGVLLVIVLAVALLMPHRVQFCTSCT